VEASTLLAKIGLDRAVAKVLFMGPMRAIITAATMKLKVHGTLTNPRTTQLRIWVPMVEVSIPAEGIPVAVAEMEGATDRGHLSARQSLPQHR